MKYLFACLLLLISIFSEGQITGKAKAFLEVTWIGNDSITVVVNDQKQVFGPDQTKIFELRPDTTFQLKVISINLQEYFYAGILPQIQDGKQYVQVNLNNNQVEWLNFETEIDQKVRIKLEEILAEQNLEQQQLDELAKKQAFEKSEKEKVEKEKVEKEKIEKEMAEKERLEKERIEKERIKNEIIKMAINSIKIGLINGGEFKMGIKKDAEERNDTKPVHKVILSNFYMGKTEITFEQYDAFCLETNWTKPNDSGWGRGNLPVINITWDDATAFCKWLSSKTGKSFRLPTEAEWEYASRAGTSTLYNTGDCLTDEYANYNGFLNYEKCKKGLNRGKTIPVGSLNPNSFGLFDMLGNVSEFCSDWYGEEYYNESPKDNPKGPLSGKSHVIRGGSFLNSEASCNSYSRFFVDPTYFLCTIGFRVVADY
jgi:formylglycine-generating enzyme